MKATLTFFLASLLLVVCLAQRAAAAAPDPICGTWRWFDKRVRTFYPLGAVVNPAGRTEGTWRSDISRAGVRQYVVSFGGGKWVDRLQLSGNHNALDGRSNFNVHVSAQRMAGWPQGGPDAPPAVVPAAAPAVMPAPPGVAHGGMTLAATWMPDLTETKRELLRSLEFYTKAVLGGAERGKETVPGTIVGPFRWLMPLDDALKVLPARVNKGGERPVNLTCFPKNSLTIMSFQCKSFLDRNQTFNQLHFILDLKRRLVGVQFVEQAPVQVLWSVGPDGAREPYYNFLMLSNNASTTQEVAYQISDGGPGVKLIKTVLQRNTGLSSRAKMPGMRTLPMNMGYVECKENVHLYLTAPLARCVLDIVDANLRKPGAMR